MALRVNAGDLYRKLQKNDKAREIMEIGIELCNWGDDGNEYQILKKNLLVTINEDDNYNNNNNNDNNNNNNNNNNDNNNNDNNNNYDNNNINRVVSINGDSTKQKLIKFISKEKSEEKSNEKSNEKLNNKSLNNVGKKIPNSLTVPPAALLNNLGLLELDEKNYQIALFLFEKAASIEMSASATEHSEMKSSDGNQVSEIIRKNILRAEEGIKSSVTNI